MQILTNIDMSKNIDLNFITENFFSLNKNYKRNFQNQLINNFII